MKTSLPHKGFIIIIILFIIQTTTPEIHAETNHDNKTYQPLTNGTTLYVGGTGPNNYTKIQDAINDSTKGDTIYVFNGTYHENLLINKTITLHGQNKYTTILDGNNKNNTIFITTDYTTIINFTITNGGPNQFTAGILIQANHTYIHHNIITHNKYDGIRIPIITNDGTIYTKITYNTITNNNIGIFLQLCAHTLIANNTIYENNCGIQTFVGFLSNGCQNTTMRYNHLENNNCGIDLFGGWETTIMFNNFLHNKRHGKFYMETTATWDQNYWDRPRQLPKIILGKSRLFIFPYPYLNFDENPVSEPYLIGENL